MTFVRGSKVIRRLLPGDEATLTQRWEGVVSQGEATHTYRDFELKLIYSVCKQTAYTASPCRHAFPYVHIHTTYIVLFLVARGIAGHLQQYDQ